MTEPAPHDELRQVADAIRTVIERFVGTEAPSEVFEGVAADLEAVAERFGEHPRRANYSGFSEAANAFGDKTNAFSAAAHDNSPVQGKLNPLAPPIDLWFEGDEVVGRARLGSAYEGPPGHVHGGFVAAMFDEILGMVQSLAGTPGMTGRLSVSYRSPTPLHTELRFRGRVDSVRGRKITCSGTLHAGDVLCADAEGLFISIRPEQFNAMRIERDEKVRGAD